MATRKKTTTKKKPASKKTTRKKVAASSNRKGASYSTRFTQEERDLIEQAAEAKGWPPAQFIREAAVDRAVDTMNAAADSTGILDRLAMTLTEQLVIAPRLRAKQKELERDHLPYVWSSDALIQRYLERSAAGLEIEWPDLSIPEMDDAGLEQVRSALQSCPSEFASMLVAAWQACDEILADTAPTGFIPKFKRPGKTDSRNESNA